MYVLGGKREAKKKYLKVAKVFVAKPIGTKGNLRFFITKCGIIAIANDPSRVDKENTPIEYADLAKAKVDFVPKEDSVQYLYKKLGDDDDQITTYIPEKQVRIVRGPNKKPNPWITFLNEYKNKPSIVEKRNKGFLTYKEVVSQASAKYRKIKETPEE